jgi:hypothetical protein
MVSEDNGVTWAAQAGRFPGHYKAIAAGNGTFVAVGHTLNGEGLINTSHDGVSWSGEQTGGTPFTTVHFGNERFIAMDTRGGVHTSKDGLLWTQSLIPLGVKLSEIRYVNGVFLAQSSGGGYQWSLDGRHWSEEGAFLPSNITYGGGTYLGCDQSGRVFGARMLDTWTAASEKSHHFVDIVYGTPNQQVDSF